MTEKVKKGLKGRSDFRAAFFVAHIIAHSEPNSRLF
jgi:hypothetical protein